MNKNTFLVLILGLTVCGCSSSVEIDDQENFGNVNCEFTFNENGLREGKFRCYYPNDEIWMEGTLKSDSLKINEERVYFPSGQLKEYRFYNLLGFERYRRSYNENGKLIKEEGDFLSHLIISDPKITIQDSTVLKIFVATPPNCSYVIYGINDRGRYPMKFVKDDSIPFLSEKIIYGKTEGNFVIPLEVEFMDSILNSTEVRKVDVNFLVKKKT